MIKQIFMANLAEATCRLTRDAGSWGGGRAGPAATGVIAIHNQALTLLVWSFSAAAECPSPRSRPAARR